MANTVVWCVSMLATASQWAMKRRRSLLAGMLAQHLELLQKIFRKKSNLRAMRRKDRRGICLPRSFLCPVSHQSPFSSQGTDSPVLLGCIIQALSGCLGKQTPACDISSMLGAEGPLSMVKTHSGGGVQARGFNLGSSHLRRLSKGSGSTWSGRQATPLEQRRQARRSGTGFKSNTTSNPGLQKAGAREITRPCSIYYCLSALLPSNYGL